MRRLRCKPRGLQKGRGGSMYYQEVIDGFVRMCQSTIGRRLTGIYLHGSLAMGCFNPAQSDIDLIVVVEGGIPKDQKIRLVEQLAKLNRMASAKGLETSFVERAYCKPFVYPTPFALHFSPKYLQWIDEDPAGYVEKMRGEDTDLAAHFMIINEYGVRLYGEAIATVFGAVPRKDYADSVWRDIADAAADILEQPIYMTLNLCRALAYLKDGAVLSKAQGGAWGMAHLKEAYRPLIRQALQCYQSKGEMRAAPDLAPRFARAMLDAIKREIGK